jgi:arabinofuranan 3-O-arabinosyltransferase
MSAAVVEAPRRAEPEPPDEPQAFDRHKARIWAISLALVAASFVQSPGRVSADTKLDLYENPWGLLARALHMWDPQTASGSLQNQAFGYLFPQGPFYGVLESLGVAPWVAQRLWWALLLLVAFHGMRRLLGALDVGGESAQLFGAVVFALSPRIVSALGEVSSEVWPMAVAPWVLLPLVRHGMNGGDPRRAAARSGVAFLAVGAVNAVASGAVLVLPAIYLLTRRRGPERRRLLLWWVACIVLASVWWFVALVLLGRYSPPFLDWIESSAVTTSPDSIANATRGTTAWLAYLSGGRGPTWPAGWVLVTVPMVVLDTAVLSALGVAGLMRRDMRERLFLVAGAVVGLAALTIAWVGPLNSPVAETMRTFLDGAGSPLRNIHKFDLVLRIPLVIGLTHLVSTVRIRPIRQLPWARRVVPVIAGFALLGLVAPVVSGQIGAGPGYVAVPDYWRAAATWIDDHVEGRRSLVVPGAQPAVYYWGGTGDDVLQPLLTSAWAVRDGVPLGSAGNTRMLDGVEQVLASGRGSGALADYLTRSGIGLVVERNDLDWARVGATRPALVHAALVRSGLTRVAYFGPLIGASPFPDVVADGGLGIDLPAVEIWEVPATTGLVTRVAPPVTVAGGPEDLMAVTASGAVGTAPVFLAGDAGAAADPQVVTDGYRRREVDFGNARANASETMTATAAYRARRRVHDYWPIPPDGRQTTAVFPAGTPQASSSGAWPAAPRNRSNGWGAFQAFDGDQRTEWRSTSAVPVGEWVEVVDLPDVAVRTVTVTFDSDADAGLADVREVRIDAGGQSRTAITSSDGTARVDLGGVVSQSLRVTITRVAAGSETRAVGVRDVAFGHVVSRLMAPASALGPSDQLVASSPRDRRNGCVFLGDRPLCSDALERPGEEDAALARTVDVSSATTYRLAVTARTVGGPALDQLLVPVGAAMFAAASSSLVPDPGGRPQTAVDRDLGSGWVAGRDDQFPRLTVSWPSARRISGLRLLHDAALAASVATTVQLSFDGAAPVAADVTDDGQVSFAPVTARSVTIVPESLHRRTSLDPVTGRVTSLPWGISEVVVDGADDYRRPLSPQASTGLPCGFGPSIVIDGRTLATRVSSSVGALLDGSPVDVTVCGSSEIRLSAGTHRVSMTASGEFVPDSLVLRPVGTAVPVDAGSVETSVWGAVHREIPVLAAPGQTLLVVRENASAGWSASLDGSPLDPVRVDGWQQAWWIPAGVSGTVTLDFGPDRTYRAGLVVGALAALVLLWLALRRRDSGGDDGLRPATVPGWARELAAPALGFLLAGFVGLGVGVVARLVVRVVGRDRASLAALVALVAAGVLAAVTPWPSAASGSLGAPAQAVALVAVTLLAASGAVPRRSGAQRQGAASRPGA